MFVTLSLRVRVPNYKVTIRYLTKTMIRIPDMETLNTLELGTLGYRCLAVRLAGRHSQASKALSGSSC